MDKKTLTKKEKFKDFMHTVLGLCMMALFAWGIIAIFFPNLFNNDLEFLDSHNEYFDNFLYQKTDESENYRYVRYVREVEYVDGWQMAELDGELYKCELDVVSGYSNDMILGTVVYKEDGVVKYWSNSLSSISTANKYIYEYHYTDISQIPAAEWETYTYSSYGSFALRNVFILDSGANDEITFKLATLTISTDDYVKLVQYNNYIISEASAIFSKEKSIQIPVSETEIFFEDGLAARYAYYKDLNNDGIFSEDEIVELKIQDMYGEVDFDTLGI